MILSTQCKGTMSFAGYICYLSGKNGITNFGAGRLGTEVLIKSLI